VWISREAIATVSGISLAIVALSGCGEGGAGAQRTPQGTKVAAKGPGAVADPAAGTGASAKGSGAPTTGPPASTTGSASGSAGHTTPQSASGVKRQGAVHEVADPEEANSFPVRGTVHHRAAATPTKAGEFVPAAGAASNAEVRAELAQMHALQRAAQRAERAASGPGSGVGSVGAGGSVGGDGTIAIPAAVPEVVQKVVAGANTIADFPYVFGGGHASFVDNAYDCSGSVSYALAAGGLLSAPQTSGELEGWGVAGPGRYITVYANAGHTYMYVDSVLYNTAGRSGPYASRWQVGAVDNSGYVARHWPGL
jgi:cell wall-associated NlpC family hydrolase